MKQDVPWEMGDEFQKNNISLTQLQKMFDLSWSADPG